MLLTVNKNSYPRLTWLCQILLLGLLLAFSLNSNASSQIGKALKPSVEQEKNYQQAKIILEFVKPKDKDLKSLYEFLQNNVTFRKSIEMINKKFMFDEDLVIEFSENDGPMYLGSEKRILIDYNFILDICTMYLAKYPKASDEAMIEFAVNNTIFYTFHEVAHAFIDLHHLPIVSNEETAADNLAVILTLEYLPNGYTIIMDSAELFDMFDQAKKKYNEDDLWDEHALDSQRFYNVICLTYSKYPKELYKEASSTKSQIVLNFIKKRGSWCEPEYGIQFNRWMKLLKPHMQ